MSKSYFVGYNQLYDFRATLECEWTQEEKLKQISSEVIVLAKMRNNSTWSK